jgi:hypothetical protein
VLTLTVLIFLAESLALAAGGRKLPSKIFHLHKYTFRNNGSKGLQGVYLI